MATFGQHTPGPEAARAFASRIKGRTFIITGPSEGGIGAATAISLAHGSPKTIILAGRTLSKISSVIETIKAIDASIETIFIPLDLTDQDSIRAAAKLVLESGKAQKIHGLINNAGVMAVMPYTTTKQGIEVQFGTNHIGHFLWTNLLLERVLAAKDEGARIVNLSSEGYVCGDVRLDDYNFEDGKSYHPWIAYGASKTANILFTLHLSARLKHLGIDCFAVQPGMPSTPLYVHTQSEGLAGFSEAARLLKEMYGDAGPPIGKPEDDVKSLEESASTVIFAVADTGLDGQGGQFLKNCQIEGTKVAYASDERSAAKLWNLSEKLVGEKFAL